MCKKQSKQSLHPQLVNCMNETQFQPCLTKINDELKDLQTGNPFFPPNADAAGALEVVPVHNNMH